MAPDVFDACFLGQSHPVLDLSEALLDWIEVGGVFGQEPQLGAGGSEGIADGFGLVTAEIVHNDDVAGCEGGDENLFDIGAETFAVDGTVEDAGRGEPVTAQGANEGERPPAAVRRQAAQAFALRSPAAQRRHIGPDPCLVDEDEPVRIEAALPGLPALAAAGDVGAHLLKGKQRFF